ncbi:lipopolysaccharide biosynthesis protein [Pirellulales bacterium]|nr:lipopolysaccharide biosynthesis protein [Pirellulales bacterium]
MSTDEAHESEAVVSEPGRRLQADTLAVSVAVLLLVTVVQRSVGFGRGILFCRWLSPEALGQWEMAYSFLLLAAPLAVLGVPGSFGRYTEHFRQRGHLRTFLERAGGWTLCCSALGIVIIWVTAPSISTLLFGSDEHRLLVRGISLTLCAVIFHHTLTALLVSLRMYRVVSAMNLAQSVLFAAVALAMLTFRPGVGAIVFGYGISCFTATLAAFVWAWPGLRELEQPADSLPHNDFWPKLLRFAFFVWVTNLLSHLFAIVDRYMIVHYSGMTPAAALQQIGNYHSSRIVPLLFVSFADLLSGLIMPHLSNDWEAGRRREVDVRVNTTVKLTGLGMTALGCCVLLAAPLLFTVVLQGRYDSGLAVLPWTLAGCVSYGLFCLAQNYLWVAEKTRLATLPLVFGLVGNIALNLVLLPIWGLYGAVAATAISSSICLFTTLILCRRLGMHIDLGTWLIALLPVALGFGYETSLPLLACVLLAAVTTELILTSSERAELRRLLVNSIRAGLASLRSGTSAAARST